jgi:hypothetical protein
VFGFFGIFLNLFIPYLLHVRGDSGEKLLKHIERVGIAKSSLTGALPEYPVNFSTKKVAGFVQQFKRRAEVFRNAESIGRFVLFQCFSFCPLFFLLPLKI